MLYVERQGVKWNVSFDFLPFLDPICSTSGRVIRESPAKLVSFYQIEGRQFFVKHYRYNCSRWRPLKYFFKSSHARREWLLAQKISDSGIPVVRHLACGERRARNGLQESILITEAFDGLPASQKANLDWARILEFVEEMHRRGIFVRDLHSGNLLVGSDGREIRLVDVERAEISPAISQEKRARNLALLRLSLPVPVTSEINDLAERMRPKIIAARSKRALKHNWEFVPRRFGRLKWQLRLPFWSSQLLPILRDPDGFLEKEAVIIKAGRTSTVGWAEGVLVKRFNRRKIRNLVIDLFRSSRARRNFHKGYHLELLQIPAPQPIAFLERRRLRVLLGSYLLTKEVAGQSLAEHLQNLDRPEPAVIRAFAQLLASLHDNGFVHRDLKPGNLLLGEAGRLYVLDLDGLTYLGMVSEYRAAKDLERLARAKYYGAISRCDRISFLRFYCQARNLRRIPRRSFSFLGHRI